MLYKTKIITLLNGKYLTLFEVESLVDWEQASLAKYNLHVRVGQIRTFLNAKHKPNSTFHHPKTGKRLNGFCFCSKCAILKLALNTAMHIAHFPAVSTHYLQFLLCSFYSAVGDLYCVRNNVGSVIARCA